MTKSSLQAHAIGPSAIYVRLVIPEVEGEASLLR
jgi:hypothetical protein